MLNVSPETICLLAIKGRQFQAKEAGPLNVDEDSSNPADEDQRHVLVDDASRDAVEAEILALLNDLTERELAETLALVWVGREDVDAQDWDQAVEEALVALEPRTPNHILETPLFPHYLMTGLEGLGYDPDEIEQDIWTDEPVMDRPA